MKILMLYLEIKQMSERNFSVSQIAKQLKISRTTVYKYLEMSFEEATEWANSLSARRKKLDKYKEWIIAWLKEYPHLSAAQIKDWLLERFPDLNVADSTTRLYVNAVREEYHILKTKAVRQYEAVEEQPMGKQMQVDWGETKQKTEDNKEVKLHFISFVLSHSRYKYIEWQDCPFTTRDTIRCHENAFQYYGGMPEEIVYDQDHLITVSENAGDIILTGEFQAYKEQRGFHVYLCRKQDPESKGKIENVVKYVKYNFADSRVFSNIDNWNERCQAWLQRTGNHNVHQTIKKRPDEVFLLEKQHLQPVSHILSSKSTHSYSITRVVNKDNTIIYKSNRYSVPIGTYRPKGHNSVFIDIKEANDGRDMLIVLADNGHEILAKHELSLGKGQLIKNKNHQRDRSKGIEAFKKTVIRQFQNTKLASNYINEILENYPRYRRDQLITLQKATIDYPSVIDKALIKCVNEKLLSANDFRDVARFLSLNLQDSNEKMGEEKQNKRQKKVEVETRAISTYTDILGGVSV